MKPVEEEEEEEEEEEDSGTFLFEGQPYLEEEVFHLYSREYLFICVTNMTDQEIVIFMLDTTVSRA